MPAKRIISRSDWTDAISASGGIVSGIAKRLSLHRSTVYRYLKEQPPLEKEVHDLKKECKLMAEQNIRDALRANNLKTSSWYLGRRGKDRGDGTQSVVDSKIANFNSPRLCLPDDGRDSGEPDDSPES